MNDTDGTNSEPLRVPLSDQLGPLPEWDDPSVQAAYAVLCDGAEPPPGEHWEGFAARRIVAAVRAAERERCASICHDSDDCEEAARRIRGA